MKSVYSARDAVDAHLVKTFLDEQGIESVVQGEALSNILGEIPVTRETLPSVWVREEDYDRATEALAGFRADADAAKSGPSWTCPTCGETIEPQFSECWNCSARRP